MLHYWLSMPSTSNFQLHYCFVECSQFVWWHGRIHERWDFQVSLAGYILHKNKHQSPFFWLRNMSARRISLVILLHHVFCIPLKLLFVVPWSTGSVETCSIFLQGFVQSWWVCSVPIFIDCFCDSIPIQVKFT